MRLASSLVSFIVLGSLLVLSSCKPDNTDNLENMLYDLTGGDSRTWLMEEMPIGACDPFPSSFDYYGRLVMSQQNQEGWYINSQCGFRAKWKLDPFEDEKKEGYAYLTLTLFNGSKIEYEQRFLLSFYVNENEPEYTGEYGMRILLKDLSTGLETSGGLLEYGESPISLKSYCQNGEFNFRERGIDCGGICPTDCGETKINPYSIALLDGGQSVAILNQSFWYELIILDGPNEAYNRKKVTPTSFGRYAQINRSEAGGFWVPGNPASGSGSFINFLANGTQTSPITVSQDVGFGGTYDKLSNQTASGFAAFSENSVLQSFDNANQLVSTSKVVFDALSDLTYIDDHSPAKVLVVDARRFTAFNASDLNAAPIFVKPVDGIVDADFGVEADTPGESFIYAIKANSQELLVMDSETGDVLDALSLAAYGTPQFISVRDDVVAVYFSSSKKLVFFNHNATTLPGTLSVLKTWTLS